MSKRIYFDNAATSFPKPKCVHDAMTDYATRVGASSGRGAYQEAMESGELISETRRLVADLIGGKNPDHVVMTFNCTDALSIAIKGLIKDRSDHVITTRMDHNSVLRPLAELEQTLGIDVTYVDACPEGLIDPDDIRQAIRTNTKLVAVVHASNVSGSLQDIDAVGQITHEHGIPFLVDAAQTIGHMPINIEKSHIDLLAFPGHKGLMGPLGTGILYIRPGLEFKVSPLRVGGTGSKSELAVQPDFMPDRFESGSHNAIGIAGLNASIKYLLDKGIESIHEHETDLCREFLNLSSGIDGLTVYGPKDVRNRMGVFSVTLDGYSPNELSNLLEEKFGLLTRSGLHCAPYAHQVIGTYDRSGTTRFSTSFNHSIEDISFAVSSLNEIAKMCVNQA